MMIYYHRTHMFMSECDMTSFLLPFPFLFPFSFVFFPFSRSHSFSFSLSLIPTLVCVVLVCVLVAYVCSRVLWCCQVFLWFLLPWLLMWLHSLLSPINGCAQHVVVMYHLKPLRSLHNHNSTHAQPTQIQQQQHGISTIHINTK